jgi:Na+(H+)/acetate symporter ActP
MVAVLLSAVQAGLHGTSMKTIGLALAGVAFAVANVFYILGVFFTASTEAAYGKLWPMTVMGFAVALVLCLVFPCFRVITSGFVVGSMLTYPLIFWGVIGVNVGLDLFSVQVLLTAVASVAGALRGRTKREPRRKECLPRGPSDNAPQ